MRDRRPGPILGVGSMRCETRSFIETFGANQDHRPSQVAVMRLLLTAGPFKVSTYWAREALAGVPHPRSAHKRIEFAHFASNEGSKSACMNARPGRLVGIRGLLLEFQHDPGGGV